MCGLVGLVKSEQKELGFGWEPSMWGFDSMKKPNNDVVDFLE